MGLGTGRALTQSNGSPSFDQMNAEIFSFTSRVMTSRRQVSLRTAMRLVKKQAMMNFGQLPPISGSFYKTNTVMHPIL